MIKRVSVLVLISIFCSCFFFKFVFAEDYITEKEIMNFTYHLTSLKGSFTLNDGKFKSGSSSENFVEVYIFDYKIVDLDGDGVNDAVVILKASYGSSIFTEITVLLKNSNGIVQTNSVLVGDKVEIKNFSIKKRRLSSGIPLVWLPAEINLNIIRQESNDTMIKPTKLEEKCLNLYKNALIDCEELEHYHIVKKPAIYLYPTKKQKVFLKVNANGTLTKTIPEYKDGWDITANPNGKINIDTITYFTKLNLLQNQC
ncbi:hypothetical protein [Sulfurihydrogenibium azorense]|uniref:hypothetical protein n=1 Tax=Sulfurihydrogenibium azorense TaxID=309806 RepID=UPI00391CF8F3